MILESITLETPFAVARYGDGEFIVTQLNHPAINVSYEKHFGFTPSDKVKIQIRENVLKSVIGLDVIGITELSSGTWGDSRVFWEMHAKQPIVSLDFHSYFAQHGITEMILRKSKKLLYISGHTINFQKFENLQEIVHLDIPLQQCKYNDNRVYFPQYFDKIMNSINGMDLTGWTCLVGGGFVGKPFMVAIKKRGGVAIDLGSHMDRLAGYVIRGTHGKIATIDTTFKL